MIPLRPSTASPTLPKGTCPLTYNMRNFAPIITTQLRLKIREVRTNAMSDTDETDALDNLANLFAKGLKGVTDDAGNAIDPPDSVPHDHSAVTDDGDVDDVEDEAAGAVTKMLVLFDFNGLLVYRLKDRFPLHSSLPSWTAGHGRAASVMYVRPGAMELVSRVLEDGRCDAGIYTSMKRHNMEEFIRQFDRYQRQHARQFKPVTVYESASSAALVATAPSSLMESLASGGLRIFDREYNVPQTGPGASEWETKRNLQLVWCDPVVKSKGYGPRNTVLIECDPGKSEDYTEVTLQPYELTREEVLAGARKDRTLWVLGDALESIFQRMQAPGAVLSAIVASAKGMLPGP